MKIILKNIKDEEMLINMVDKGTTMVGKDPAMVDKEPTMVDKEIPNEIRIWKCLT